MVISVIYEGFANQLYRYCTAYATAQKLQKKLILIVQCSQAISDPFQLSEFPIEYSQLFVTRSIIETNNILLKFKKEHNIIELNDSNYYKSITDGSCLNYDGIILNGHFQIEAYFSDYFPHLRQMLQFKTPSPFLEAFREEISNKLSVGIHIRRGDFLFYDGPAAQLDYYKAAMCYIENTLGASTPDYYIFSDDINYVKEILGCHPRIHYVCNYGNFREAIEEFIALSMCQNHILTTASSYSRLADGFCENQNKITVFDSRGFEFFIQHKNNLVLLDENHINKLSNYYDFFFSTIDSPKKEDVQNQTLLHKCIDSTYVTKEEEISIRMNLIKMNIEKELFSIALGQVRKLWEFLFESNSDSEMMMHDHFFTCLFNLGYFAESKIEALHLPKILDSNSKFFSEKTTQELLRIDKKSFSFIIIPSRLFNPMYYENMVHFGVLLRRMGFDVTFMFFELTPDMEKYEPFNKKLKEYDFFIKSRGIDTKCKQVDLNEKIKEYGSLESYFSQFCKGKGKTVFVYKQKHILEALKKSGITNSFNLFWDYSNPNDAGSYLEAGDRIIPESLETSDLLFCYEESDLYITYEKTYNFATPVVYMHEVTSNHDTNNIADFDNIDDTFIDDTFCILNTINKLF